MGTLVIGSIATGLGVGVPLAVSAWHQAGGDPQPAPPPVVSHGAAPPSVVGRAASAQGVTYLHLLAADPSGRIGVFSGIDSTGQPVVSFGSATFAGGFAPLGHILNGSDLAVRATAGGPDATTVTWAGIFGVASAGVASVEVISKDGTSQRMAVPESAFAFSTTDPARFPTKVVAYDSAGLVVATNDVEPANPPGPTGSGSG